MSRYEYPNSYYAYNETFVDDEGVSCYQRENQHQQAQKLSSERRSNYYLHDEEEYYEQSGDNHPGYYEGYDDRLDYLNLSTRQSPIGEGSNFRNSELPSSAANQQKQQQPAGRSRQRSSSVPGRRRNAAPNVFAPMMAQAERHQTLRRSHSTVLPSQLQRNRQMEPMRDYRRPFQVCPTPRIQRHTSTPMHLKSYSHLVPSAETSLIRDPHHRNTAIISPNYRHPTDMQSALPLLTGSPTKLRLVSSSPNKSNSWMNLSGQRLPAEPLWFAGVLLLLTGGITCLLCLYILSKNGRKFYLDFGAVSGFVCLILGLIGCRTTRWLPHRHYVTGYILLSAFSLLQCGILAVLASDSKQLDNDIIDIAGGAICGLSALSLILATLGFLTSACCNLMPPDSRIGHSVPGFTV